jgi:NADH-quinone oxidoreductase subunit M
MARQMPVWTIFFVVAGMASLGLPGLSGFVAEVHIFIGAFRAYPVVGALAVLTAAITATYLLRMFSQTFFGPLNPRWSGLREITWAERASYRLSFLTDASTTWQRVSFSALKAMAPGTVDIIESKARI